MFLMILGDTNNPGLDQVLYCFYKTDYHMEEHAPNINNTDKFPPEGFQVPDLTKYDEVDQETFSIGAEYDYYSYK